MLFKNLKIKYIIGKLLAIFALFFTTNIYAQSIPEECNDKYAALIFEEKTGKIIFEKRSDERIYPASLTKLMTVYLVFEAVKENKLSMDALIIASDRAAEAGSVNKVNTLKLKTGDHILLKDAINASIVKSFNETTVMLAEEVAGTEWKFVRMMNKKAKELGMYHTNFRNASGLPDFGQYTTTYDLARLVMALKKDFPEHYHLFALKEFKLNGIKYTSHNNVLLEYKGAEGMKTGFTSMSGFNLIAIAKRDKVRVVSILTSCPTYQKRDKFTKQLLDWSFEKILSKNGEKIEGAEFKPVANLYMDVPGQDQNEDEIE